MNVVSPDEKPPSGLPPPASGLGPAQPAGDLGLQTGGSRKASLKELAQLFLRLGCTSFGGPAAHNALMEDEVVARRQWLSRQQFLDLMGAASLIPGPTSSELAIYIGQRQAGWPGLVLAGLCFILPAAVLSGAIAWAYLQYGTLPAMAGILYGIKPIVIAIVIQALWRLGRSAAKNVYLGALAIAAVAANLLGAEPILVLLAAAGIGVLPALARRGRPPLMFCMPALAGAAASAGTTLSLWALFLVFLKVGAIVFGSGYVLLAFLRADLVERLHWLTENQLLDAVAVGQVTPGPVFSTATFIGYLLAGTPGAIVATVGIFLPAFLLVSVSGPFIPLLRKSATAAGVLDAVNAASLAIMAVVSWQLGRLAIVDWPTAGLALLSGILLFRFRLNSVWLVLIGGGAGFLLSR